MIEELNPGGEITGRRRLVPQRPLPPYSYVPGFEPHPVSNSQGHMFAHPVADSAAPLDPCAWRQNETYLHGVDLFNHGYYWEAHEAWEEVWHASGRKGTAADFLKALIKLAAAAVKAREGSVNGAARHARRCRELVESIQQGLGSSYAGVELQAVSNLGERIATGARGGPLPKVVFDAILLLQ